MEPPPRTSRITSTAGVPPGAAGSPARPAGVNRYSAESARTSSAGAAAPCTAAGATTTGMCGTRRCRAVTTSCKRRRPQRGDHPDGARHHRQRPFAGRIETGLRASSFAFRRKNCSNSAPCPARCRLSTINCRSPRGLVDAQAAAQFDQFAIARREVQQAGSTAEHGAADLAGFVLERKVAMSAGSAREARNLAAHRNRVESRIQRISHGAAQRANLPDSWRQCWVFRAGHQSPCALAGHLTAVTTPQAARFAGCTDRIGDNADFSVQLIDLYEFFSAQFVINLSRGRDFMRLETP